MEFAIAFAFLNRQINPNIVDQRALEPYLRCVVACFGSIRRFHSDADLRLYCNQSPPVAWVEALEQFAVELQVIPFHHEPPEDFMAAFQASLFSIDVLFQLENAELTVLLDPDILCVSSLQPGWLPPGQLTALDMRFPLDYIINGLSRFDQSKLVGIDADNYRHFGGEFYAFAPGTVNQITGRLERLWLEALAAHARGVQHLQTEEHFISAALNQLHVNPVANQQVARLWTTPRYRHLPDNWADLTFWHLPAEKGYGFDRIYRAAINQNSWFWNTDDVEFRSISAKVLGVSRPNLRTTVSRILNRVI